MTACPGMRKRQPGRQCPDSSPCLRTQIILEPLHDMLCLLRQRNTLCSLLMALLYSITARQMALYLVVLWLDSWSV